MRVAIVAGLDNMKVVVAIDPADLVDVEVGQLTDLADKMERVSHADAVEMFATFVRRIQNQHDRTRTRGSGAPDVQRSAGHFPPNTEVPGVR